ncbi:MAG TPA: clostripain-related cysteine peptidase [Nocardioides sp.]|nr:clostripain-related cysteine peptidase [Nocardioides sp.]
MAGLMGTAAALSPSATGASVAAPADAPTAEWTMMLYAVADTENIGSDMTKDLAELADLPDDPDVNVVVLVDMPDPSEPNGGPRTLPGIGQFSTGKLLKLEGGRYEEIRDLGELPMSRPDTLASFIAEAADRFPARHYGLTLMDHGAANWGGYLDHTPSTEQLSVGDIRNGIVMGMQKAGIDRFDVIVHSACLMSNYEAASALAPLADFIAGSEEVMWVFAMLPQAEFAAAQAGGSGQDVAQAFTDGYAARLDRAAQDEPAYAAQWGQLRDLVSMSVVEGDHMAALDQALAAFSNVAVAHMDEILTQVARARAQALQFVVRSPNTNTSDWDLFDLGDFLSHLQDVPDDVAVARDAAYTALTNAVIHQTTGRGTSQAKGLSIYLPTTARWMDDYAAGGMPPAWVEFVKAFAAAAQAAGIDPGDPGARFASRDATVLQADASGIKIAGQLVPRGSHYVAYAETQVYAPVGGQKNALAVDLPAYVDAGGEDQVQGTWDYSVTALTDGQTVVPVTGVYQGLENGLIGTFTAQYVPPAGEPMDIGVRLLLTTQGDIQSVSTFSVEADGRQSSAGVTLANGGQLTPYIVARSPNGFQELLSDQSITVTDQLTVGFVKLPAGTRFQMGIVVADAGGKFDGAHTTTQEVR